jgi:putative SOS response-associated peptidase YedK
MARPERTKDQVVFDLNDNAERVTALVHDRMPVILKRDDHDLWLDPGMTDVEVLSDLLKPFDAHAMRSYPANSRVNQVQNDDPECSAPVVMESAPQGRLFF